MIRVLLMIAVSGFLVSVVSLAAAVGIGGPDLLEHGAWTWSPGPGGHWGWRREGHGFGLQITDNDHKAGAEGTRKLAWTGGDTLIVEAPADIRYVQGDGPAELTINGATQALDDLVLKDGRLSFGGGSAHRHWGRLDIVMRAPAVRRFELDGADSLVIESYRQPELNLDLAGDARVKVSGEAQALDLQVSGSASTDLAALKLQSAKVEIDGSGDATLAPAESADIRISGSGDVTLLTRPAHLETKISGSGEVHQADATPKPPAPPARGKKA